MLSSLTAAVSGLEAFQNQMNVIGNNIATVDTTGFKAGVVDFADAFSNTLRAPSGSSSSTSGSDSIQIGTGVTITGVTSNWNQGALSTTGINSDLAGIKAGNGFFMVRDTVNVIQPNTPPARVILPWIRMEHLAHRLRRARAGGIPTAPSPPSGTIKIDTSGMPATSGPQRHCFFFFHQRHRPDHRDSFRQYLVRPRPGLVAEFSRSQPRW